MGAPPPHSRGLSGLAPGRPPELEVHGSPSLEETLEPTKDSHLSGPVLLPPAPLIEGAVLLGLPLLLKTPDLSPARLCWSDTQQTALGSTTFTHTDFKLGTQDSLGRTLAARVKKAKPEGSKNAEGAAAAQGSSLGLLVVRQCMTEFGRWPVCGGGQSGQPPPTSHIDEASSTYQEVALAKEQMPTLSPIRLLGETLPERCPTGPSR